MTSAQTPLGVESTLPDHRQLPESDGTFVFAECAGGKNLQEHPQSLFVADRMGAMSTTGYAYATFGYKIKRTSYEP